MVEFKGKRRDAPQLLQEADISLHVPLLEEGFGLLL